MTEDDLVHWVTNKLSVPREEFNGFPPCPYALQALTQKRVVLLEPPVDLIAVNSLLKKDHKEIVIYWFDPESISAHELYIRCQQVNWCYPDLLALDDHPHNEEHVVGVKVNQGKWALMMIQIRKSVQVA